MLKNIEINYNVGTKWLKKTLIRKNNDVAIQTQIKNLPIKEATKSLNCYGIATQKMFCIKDFFSKYDQIR